MDSKHIISAGASVIQALERLNALPGNRMTLIVVDSNNRPVGTLTDGDIRRALLKGIQPSDPALLAAMPDFQRLVKGEVCVAALKELRGKGITLIPVVDSEGYLCDIVDLSNSRTRLPLRAVVMAGGKGERLRPATLTTPKPLLKIEGKAIIDYNIESLAAVGINDITVTARYLAHQIKEHFSGPVAGVRVKVVEETEPLGTIGSVTLCPPAEPEIAGTLVMNSDLLTTISFEDMFIRHQQSGADVTIAVIPYQVSVPYAILTLDENHPESVRGIEEKPSYSYYANAGIYIFSDKALSLLKKDARCDATDLIEQAIAAGMPVTYYPIQGTWIDVGSPVDFRQAGELMRHHNSLSRD